MKLRPDPKILVATAFPPDVPGGSPWLFYQLLRGVDPTRVSWWSISGRSPKHTKERVGTYQEGGLPRRLVPHRRFVSMKCFLLETFWVPLAARKLRRFIAEQKPDLLWILGYGWSIPVLHRVIPELGIPWHITVHDMADTDGQVGALGARRAARFQRMMEDLYSKSASRDVYSKEIGREMERMSGKKNDLIIHCGAEPEEMQRIRNEVFRRKDDKIRIGYPGTIISENTFACFIAALKMLPWATRGRVEVHLFGSHSYRLRDWFDPALIVEHGYLPEAELERRYRDCDWGLAIMAINDSNPRYNKFSFPCKFARALASGLPVLCVAHPESTLASFAMNHPFSPVISAVDPIDMAADLHDLLPRGKMRDQLRDQILECLEDEFNAEKNREALFGVFLRISQALHPTPRRP